MSYDPQFIPGVDIPLPNLSPALEADAFHNGRPIDHTRFSIIFNQKRGLAVLTAHNIDGASFIAGGKIKRKSFIFDPDVPAEIQIDNDRGYRKKPWDRGHLVRRRSLHWGNFDEAEKADRESSFWTNIAPQHETLHHSAWGDIEDFILDLTDDLDRRAAVFQAPVLTPHDPFHQNQPDEEPIQIPAGFWKIMATKHQGRLRAAAFLVWQRDFDKPEPESFDPLLEQVRITTIEFLTGLSFPQVLRDADPLHFSSDRRLSQPSSLSLESAGPSISPQPEVPTPMRSTAIRTAADILL